MDFPSLQELINIAKDEIITRSSKITKSVVDREGTDAYAMAGAAGGVGDELIGQLSSVACALYLDTAKGTKLDRLVYDRFNLIRKPASAAQGTVQFTTGAPVVVPFAVEAGTRLATGDGRQFTVELGVTFPNGSTGPIQANVRSVLAGSDQQAQIGTITNIVSTIPNAPADLVVTNAQATAGAADVEADEEFVARARLVIPNARRGTLGAIESAALAYPGVRSATAIESVDSMGRPCGSVQLVITDQYTDALIRQNVFPAAYAAQSQALADAVLPALDEARAAGIWVHILVGQIVLQPIQLLLTFAAGTDIHAAVEHARGVVVAYVNGLPPGAPLIRADISDMLRVVPGLVISGNEVLSPPGDVIPSELQIIRTTRSMVVSTVC
jgi:uncharacterized phage protein gp47/JayE